MTALDYCYATIHGFHSVFGINMSSGLTDSFQLCSTLNEFQMKFLKLEWAKVYGRIEIGWVRVSYIINVNYWRSDRRLLWVEYCIPNFHALLELLECDYYTLNGNPPPKTYMLKLPLVPVNVNLLGDYIFANKNS